MINDDTTIEVLEACDKRRDARRAFLRGTGGVAAMAGFGALAACDSGGKNNGGDGGFVTPPTATPAPPPPPTSAMLDQDILNFALNLEYLEAQFYSFAATGAGLPANLLTGTGAQGQATGGRRVNFTDPIVAQYAREIAADERAHVAFLRSALGASAVAQPAINISADANGPFSGAARAAGIIGANQAFDPYANDENFLLGAFIFEDVGVTAYKGASPLITSKTFLDAAAGILAAEAYHAALVRTTLFVKGLEVPSSNLIQRTEQISFARDSLNDPPDRDQGVAPIGNQSNIVPADANGLAFSRSAGEVLNIVYLIGTVATAGGFFPNGVNGNIRASA